MKGVFLLLNWLLIFGSINLSQSQIIRFAAIGDYGWDERNTSAPNDSGAKKVANFVTSLQTDTNFFIITLGDNNYGKDGDGAAEIYYSDDNIGRFYHDYIQPRTGWMNYVYNGPVSNPRRFFPALGNHDFYNYALGWVKGRPYYEYFSITSYSSNGTGAERYYDFVQGNVHFFVVNSGLAGDDTCAHCEPDGFTNNSTQAQWFKARLEESTSKWNIVYLHHPPFNSEYNVYSDLRWDFRKWGVTIVMAGHSHVYERLIVDSLTYTINGLGGRSITVIALHHLQIPPKFYTILNMVHN
jgi:hypothetical protein